jgi:hypothetical protein
VPSGTGTATGIAVTGGMLFVEYANGKVGGYRPSGFGTWLAETGAGLYGTPAIVDNAVIVGAGDGSRVCLHPVRPAHDLRDTSA